MTRMISAYPKTPGHTKAESFRSSIVGTSVSLEVVVNIEVIEESLSRGVVVGMHLLKEPWDEVDVVVSRGVRPADLARPVYQAKINNS